MAKLTNRYALALVNYASETNQLEKIYKQALQFTGENTGEELEPISDEITAFIEFVLKGEIQPVMRRFVEVAREKLGIIHARVASPIPLTEAQLSKIEEKLYIQFGKKVEMSTEIDEDLLGGFRVTVGDIVIDCSIKRLISEMKNNLYKGVSLV
ncbi:ATP synthase F1 subunit delta [Anaeropeptidivorans aminofermentans]|jgi:ATP synthase F1 delta subunit|uniref:ATP synthase F1 subunit delta n=1 Tax=Anaeropeptidivorans aminofermentans TaxID=2934315 RepID=UPI002024C856|nr:ATP synthase F1 subunit delta [Anaeropeptidivorans aminofermentans]